MLELVEKGWDIGVNGCSMKTKENCEVVKCVPLERLQVETDGPWCEMRASHASADFLLEMGVGVKAVRISKANGKANGKAKGDHNKAEGKIGSTESTEPREQLNQTTEKLEQTEQEPQNAVEAEEEEDQNGTLHEWPSVKKERWSEGMMIKGRNEPCMIGHVAWAIAGIKGLSVKRVSEAAWENSARMFGVCGD